MNDKLPNHVNSDDENVAKKLSRVAEQTNVNAQFASELEKELRNRYQPKMSGPASIFTQISPALRWVALMVLLALVLSWSIKSLIPAPQPATNNTPTITVPATETPTPESINVTATPATKEGGYDFRGAKLYLQQPLPTSPDKAHVYLLKKDEPATAEQARALADRFGIQGQMYTAPNYIFNTTDYVFSDGKQNLQVYSQRFFTYIADMSKTSMVSTNTPNDNAETIIRDFLKSRGFDFSFTVTLSDFFHAYLVRPLSPDSIPIQYEPYTQPIMSVMLDENGEVLRIDASLVDYDPASVGEYGISSAEDALQIVLDDHIQAGRLEFVHSTDEGLHDWYRSYPDNQPVIVYGHLSMYPTIDLSKPALVLLDGVPVTGNIDGLDTLEHYTFIRATGQYIVENGIRKFHVESWDRKVQEATLPGTLSRQGDQVILTQDDGTQYPLIDPPANPPLEIKAPATLEVYGALEDNKISWTFMRLFDNNNSMGGGGGGGGLGFYKLNLTGSPVPFPSPTPQSSITMPPTGVYTVKAGDTLIAISQTFGITVDELMRLNNLTDSAIYVGQTLNVPISDIPERKVEDLRGYLYISIHNKGDGTSSKEYILEVQQDGDSSGIYTMEGSILSELDTYNALPILVTGVIDKTGKLVVDSYKIPYPDLQFQILKGTQKIEQVNGQNVVVFTTEEGKSYVEFLVTNNIPNTTSITGVQGDLIQEEVLILPDESFGGMPVAHTYQTSIVQKNAPEMKVQANQIHVLNDSNDPGLLTNPTQPDLTIEQVELAYYVSNPYYQVNDPNYSQRSPYIQPVWHFRGHFSNGQGFDMLVQALKQEFLLPEIGPGPGLG